MASLNLNSIIGMSLARVGSLPRQNSTPSQQSSVPSSSSTDHVDSFTQGEWWKNKAQSDLGSGQDLALYSRVDAAGAALTPNYLSPDSEVQVRKPVAKGDVEVEEDSQESRQNTKKGGDEGSVAPKAPDGEPLGVAEMELLSKLQKADADVRAHEMAHLAAAGSYAKGGASFTYQKGPDGKSYAVGGEVAIDMGKESSPSATLLKMRVVRQAALAPKDPSPQDQKVAAQATMNIAAAVGELRELAQAGLGKDSPAELKDNTVGEQADTEPQSRDIFSEYSPAQNESQKSVFTPFKSIGSYGQANSSSNRSAGLDLLA